MKFIVFGLGNFGKALAIRLTELGHEVIGVDENMAKVEQLKEQITHTVCMDCTDRDAVSSLPLKDANAVIVAIGENEAASLLSTALLRQFNIKRIISRVVSDLQKTVLTAMKVEEFIMPEEDSAERLAVRLVNLNIIDSFKVSEKYSIIEAVVPERYEGKTLAETDFTNRYKIIVLTTLRPSKRQHTDTIEIHKEATGIAKSDTVLQKDDILVLFGNPNDINKMIEAV